MIAANEKAGRQVHTAIGSAIPSSVHIGGEGGIGPVMRGLCVVDDVDFGHGPSLRDIFTKGREPER